MIFFQISFTFICNPTLNWELLLFEFQNFREKFSKQRNLRRLFIVIRLQAFFFENLLSCELQGRK